MFKHRSALLLTTLLLILIAAAMFAWWAREPVQLSAPVEFTIAPGSGAGAVGASIAAAGVPMPGVLFAVLARASGRAQRLKAGTYVAESGITPWNLIDKIVRGAVIQFSLAVPEGWTFAQMRAAVAANANLNATLAKASDAEVLRAVSAIETQAEGLFFPDTYVFARGTTDVDVYKRAYRSWQQRLAAAWEARAPDLPLKSPYEALILASVVEKETGRAEERPLIAAVFINRLRLGMPLQSDPTVIYGLGAKFDGDLRRRDLRTDNAYNSYTRAGLPPTPIALPGAAALAAVLHPAPSNALYFVARGDGSSAFSHSLDEHNRAVNLYQRGRR